MENLERKKKKLKLTRIQSSSPVFKWSEQKRNWLKFKLTIVFFFIEFERNCFGPKIPAKKLKKKLFTAFKLYLAFLKIYFDMGAVTRKTMKTVSTPWKFYKDPILHNFSALHTKFLKKQDKIDVLSTF